MTKLRNIFLKRRIISSDECKLDLKNDLPKLFYALENAVTLFEKEIAQTPPTARVRLEAALMNSKIIQCIQRDFQDQWTFAKYRRFVLRTKGYNILFKKLNKNNMPMNIKTNNNQAIMNQAQSPTLFDDPCSLVEPIVYFGYKVDKFGTVIDPKLVYIDDGKISWEIAKDDIDNIIVKNNYVTEEKKAPKLKSKATNIQNVS